MNRFRFATTLIISVLLFTGLRNPTPAQAAMPPGITHVFTIVMENHDWSKIKSSRYAPYINSLLARDDAAYASNYHNLNPSLGILHPSEPAYVWLEAGTNRFSDHVFQGDHNPGVNSSTSSPNHLATLLQNKNLTWKAYQEDITGTNCPIFAHKWYAPRHNAMIYFKDVTGNNNPNSASCISHIRPFSELSADRTNDNVANYNFITPNLLHDMHNGTIAQADAWLKDNLPTILNSNAYKSNGAIFITWDEGNAGNNPIGMIILSPKSKGHGFTNNLLYDHSSYVKTIEEIFGLSPLLGHAADTSTRSLDDFFIASAATPTQRQSSYSSTTPHDTTSAASKIQANNSIAAVLIIITIFGSATLAFLAIKRLHQKS